MVSIARRVSLLSHVLVLLAGMVVMLLILRVPRAPLPIEAVEDLAAQVVNSSDVLWPVASIAFVAAPGTFSASLLEQLAQRLEQMLPERIDSSVREKALPESIQVCAGASPGDCLEQLELQETSAGEPLKRHFTVYVVQPSSQGTSALLLDAGQSAVLQWSMLSAPSASQQELEELAAHVADALKATWFRRLQFGVEVPLFEMAPAFVFSFFLVGDCSRRVAWDFLDSVLGPYLLQFLNRLHILFNFEVDSQVVQCGSLGGKQLASGEMLIDSAALQADLLRRAGEWPGDAVIKDVRWLPPLVRFVAFRPSGPVTILDTEKRQQKSFAVQGWGIVAVASPSNGEAADESQTLADILPSEEAQNVASAWVSSLRSWLMLSPDGIVQQSGAEGFQFHAARPRFQGIAGWELLLVARAVHELFLRRAAETLQNMIDLVQSLPDLVVRAEIGNMAQEATALAHKGLLASKAGDLTEALVSSRRALHLALETLHDDTVVAEMFFSWEFKYAVYLPVALPIALPVLVACIREMKGMRALRKLRQDGAKPSPSEQRAEEVH